MYIFYNKCVSIFVYFSFDVQKKYSKKKKMLFHSFQKYITLVIDLF